MSKKKLCNRCGESVDSYSYGDYCYTCANDVWDSGFESSSQHADEIYEKEEKNKEELNIKLNRSKINYKDVINILKYEYGRLRCSKCAYVRIRLNIFKKIRENDVLFEETLKKRCAKCKVIGFYKFESYY